MSCSQIRFAVSPGLDGLDQEIVPKKLGLF